MNSKVLFDNITTHVVQLASGIRLGNRLNLTDDANYAEDLYCRLLNTIYGYALTNANKGTANVKTIDLKDNKNKIVFQITSEARPTAKFKKTKNSFVNDASFKAYDKLCVFFITSEKLPLDIKQKHTAGKSRICYAICLSELLSDIKTLAPKKKQAVLSILEEELATLDGNKTKGKPVFNAGVIKKQWTKPSGSMLHIDRQANIEKLFAMAASNNCLVIGKPGIGKSYVLTQFHDYCWDHESISILIKVDSLREGTDEEINQLLKTEYNWLETLNAYKGKKNCFLIFDAFDTAREDRLRKNVLALIAKGLQNLNSKWKLIVSVREYDALKSFSLLQLFSTNQSTDLKKCHRFTVDPLDPSEVIVALQHIAHLKVEQLSVKLKEILRIPYFLSIFNEVVVSINDTDFSQLQLIHTEEQLLDLFWQRKISLTTDGVKKESLLHRLATELYHSEKLSADKKQFLNNSDEDIYHTLLSDGILFETGIYSRNLAFSHNILFDYAIARLVIAADIENFKAQIDQSNKRPFIFRPSYLYFLNRMWADDNTLFWNYYVDIWKENKAPYNIIHQAFFNWILTVNFTSLDELNPILKDTRLPQHEILLFRFLVSMRFIMGKEVREQDNQLFLHLSVQPHVKYMWVLGENIERSFESPNTSKQHTAKAAVNFLSAALAGRKSINKNEASIFENNIAKYGVINICRALLYSPSQAAKLINDCLAILQEDNFPIWIFQQLTRQMKELSAASPKLAQKVFLTIYSRTENSKEETVSGGALINLRSNRGQDFHSCYYQLEKSFPYFLEEHPLLAAELCIKLINHLHGHNFTRRSFGIRIHGVNARVTEDGSIGEWDHEYKDGVGKLLSAFFDYLEKHSQAPLKITAVLQLLMKDSEKTFLWKNLIKFFTRHADIYYMDAYALLQNDVFLLINETSYEAGELLKVIIKFLSKTQKKKIENLIISLPDSKTFKKLKWTYVDDTIATLLSCFTLPELQYTKSRNFILKAGTRENIPLVSGGGVSVRRGEIPDPLASINVSSEDTDNVQYKKKLSELKDLVTLADIKNKTVTGNEASTMLQSNDWLLNNRIRISQDLIDLSDEVSVNMAKVISRAFNTLSLSTRLQCFTIAKGHLHDTRYKKAAYEQGEQNRRGSFYVPNRRIEAARVILHLSNCDDLPGLDKLIEEILIDNDQVIRSLAASTLIYFWRNNRDLFWHYTDERIQAETDDDTAMHLLKNLCYLGILKENGDKVSLILKKALTHIINRNTESNYGIQFFELMFAVINYHSSSQIGSFVPTQYLNHEFIDGFVNKAESWLNRSAKPGSEVSPHLKEFIYGEFKNIISAQVEDLKSIGLKHENTHDRFGVLDHLVQRIFFLLKIDEETKSMDATNTLYMELKPILSYLLDRSEEIDGGILVAHTGYYLMQILERFIEIDAADILKMFCQLVTLSASTGFTGEHATLQITLRITERYLSDYKDLIMNDNYFQYMLKILQLYVESGWQEALEFIWRLNEIL